MDIFLNELSLRTAPDRYAANSWFEALGAVYKAAAAKGLGEIKVPQVFFGHHFCEAYVFEQWANAQEFDVDLRTLLKSKITTTPVIEDMLREKQDGANRAFECYYDGEPALGLGAASPFMFDSFAISFSCNSAWDRSRVPVNITLFDGEELEEEHCDVRNLFQCPHLDEHTDWFEARRRPLMPNGQVLWLKRSQVFPNLIFCEHVRGQIAGFSGNQLNFLQMQKKLYELDEYAARWTAGPFKASELPSKVTPESETRKRDFANELTHVCPDGITRLFDWHSRFTPGAGRIHFFPLEDSHKIIIGSIANQNVVK